MLRPDSSVSDRTHSLPLLAALAVLAAAPVVAQPPAPASPQPDIEVVLEGGQRPPLRLAAPAPRGIETLSAAAAAAANEIDTTLRYDLEISGAFQLQGPLELAVLRLTGNQEEDFELYRSLANEVLLEVDFSAEGDRLVLEGRVFDLKSGRSVLGKRYRGELRVARRIAHTFADEIIQYFTGRSGVSLTSIAFQSDRVGEKNREIYLMDYDGHNQHPVTAHKTISMSPTWHPSGDRLAYVSFLQGQPGIFLVELASGGKSPLVTQGNFNASPSFSPDGRSLAFARSVGDGNAEIFVADRDGGNMRRLTHSSGIDTNPAWSPTGREIAFTSSRAGSPQIYVMGSEGTDLRRVTFEGSYNDGAAWSPDGARIAHSSRRRNQFDVAITDLVTLESRVLTSFAGSHESPSFSPDGRRIVFSSTRPAGGPGRTQIYVIDVSGANLRRLTEQGNNLAPEWSSYLQ